MPAMRCSMCGINYPVAQYTSECHVCDEKTTYFSNLVPDDKWQESVDRHKKYVEDDDPIIDLGDRAILFRDGEQLFLSLEQAYHAGARRRMQEGQLFSLLINGLRVYFEVQGWQDSRRRYWVRAFEMECPDYFPEEWVEA